MKIDGEVHEHVYRCQDCGEIKPPEVDPEDCGARTNYGATFIACNKQHTHYGPHRAELPDGRVVSWEPRSPAHEAGDERPMTERERRIVTAAVRYAEAYRDRRRTADEIGKYARGVIDATLPSADEVREILTYD